jgi:hypothetical protein
MNIVYAREPFPEEIISTIFLAGPTPRETGVQSWRPEALELLKKLGFRGTVYVPEDPKGEYTEEYYNQIEWEEEALHRADCILFWIPRELQSMPAFTTNDEWGYWKKTGKVVFGAPFDAKKIRYQEYYAQKFFIPVAHTLEDTIKSALERVGHGNHRTGIECSIPIEIWETETFQSWYRNLKANGERLDKARMEYVWRYEDSHKIFLWILHADIYVPKEKRHKTNEIVIGRRNISCVVAYYPGENLLDTKIVLVREFRSAQLSPDGYVHELPGGSPREDYVNPRDVALEELLEEIGMDVEGTRLEKHHTRQLMATTLIHQAHLYSLKLKEHEFEWLKEQSRSFGSYEETEKTYIEVKSVQEIISNQNVDWAMVGMIFEALRDKYTQGTMI